MKILTLLCSASLVLALLPATTAFVLPCRQYTAPQTALFEKREALSDIDIMCIMNAADLCSYYDECHLEEREALLNRLEEQTDILSERISMMTCLVRHLKTGDHKHLEEDETATLKSQILETLDLSTPAALP